MTTNLGVTMRQGSLLETIPSSHRAYEMKFAVPANHVSPILDWARANLIPDRYADQVLGTYPVSSLYFDTDNWDTYNNCTGYNRGKYRVRRYGSEPFVFLELKLRRRRRIAKYRVRTEFSELSILEGTSPKSCWPGLWFYHGLLRKQLKPRVLVTYRRAAYVGGGEQYASRLTLDTRLSCAPAVGYTFAHPREIGIFTGQAVLELKYRGSMPEIFWTLIRTLKIEPVALSKYRLAVAAMAWANSPNARCWLSD